MPDVSQCEALTAPWSDDLSLLPGLMKEWAADYRVCQMKHDGAIRCIERFNKQK